MTVEEALEHPYLAAYYDPSDEPTVQAPDPDAFEFDDNREPPSKAELKQLLYEEVIQFEPTI